jgi:ankyrin repeat protein
MVGHIKIVQLLLEKGADVNAQGKDSDTPLSWACDGSHIEIVQLLLEKGADINAQGEDSDTPLRSACLRGDIRDGAATP